MRAEFSCKSLGLRYPLPCSLFQSSSIYLSDLCPPSVVLICYRIGIGPTAPAAICPRTREGATGQAPILKWRPQSFKIFLVLPTCPPLVLIYRNGLKSGPDLLSKSYAGPGRQFSQPRDPFLSHLCTVSNSHNLSNFVWFRVLLPKQTSFKYGSQPIVSNSSEGGAAQSVKVAEGGKGREEACRWSLMGASFASEWTTN